MILCARNYYVQEKSFYFLTERFAVTYLSQLLFSIVLFNGFRLHSTIFFRLLSATEYLQYLFNTVLFLYIMSFHSLQF